MTIVNKPELVAPAGNLESLFSAFQYGADSVYLGLDKLNARASAENFTTGKLELVLNYAKKLNKKIYVAFNVLIKTSEIDRAVDILARLECMGVDSVIVQDLGAYGIIRSYFPGLPIHLSTQMAVHNLAGVKTAEKIGAKRVILARELSISEIENIRKNTGLEIEVFVQSARCYSYSGLCLFSSLIGGRSGNRGWCAQPCRKLYFADGKRSSYFFSMRDLFALKDIQRLKSIGVDALKIEGRLKNPLYVAFTTHIYRQAIDGKYIDEKEAQDLLMCIFSRKTQSFPKTQEGEIATDPSFPGHLGLYLGNALEVKGKQVTFVTKYPLEKYDGIGILEDAGEKSIGFSLRNIVIGGENVFQSPVNARITIKVPQQVAVGSRIYLSSKRSLMDSYRIRIPKLEPLKIPIQLDLEIKPDCLFLSCGAIKKEYLATVISGKNSAFDRGLAYKYFSRLGNTQFRLEELRLSAPGGIFIPPKELNQIRRDFVEELKAHYSTEIPGLKKIKIEYPSDLSLKTANCQFTVKIDNLNYLNYVVCEADKIMIEMSDNIMENFQELLQNIKGINKIIQFSLPPVARDRDIGIYREKIAHLISLGYKQFQISNLWALDLLRYDGLNISADYHLYVTNPYTLIALNQLGIQEGTLSPELSRTDLSDIIPLVRNRVDIILYSDLAWFYTANCPWIAVYGKCHGRKDCDFRKIYFRNHEGDRFIAIKLTGSKDSAISSCLSAVISEMPFSWTQHLDYLQKLGQRRFRIEFIHKDYSSDKIGSIIKSAKQGKKIPETQSGNFKKVFY